MQTASPQRETYSSAYNKYAAHEALSCAKGKMHLT